MATLAELRTRLQRTMGLYGAVPEGDIEGHYLDCLNDALRSIGRKQKWYWWIAEDTTTLASLSAGTTTSNLPSGCRHIICVKDPDGYIVESKTVERQTFYPNKIGASSSKQTYAMGGIDSSTRVKTIIWEPALLSAGDYVLWYYRMPSDLSVDADVPDLPDEFHDYLYWRALMMVLHNDEERQHLYTEAEENANDILEDMKQDNARIIETLSRRIFATP